VDDVAEPLALFAVVAAVALASAEGKRRLLVVAKPLATLSLAAVVWKGTMDPLSMLILVGLGLSVIGDVVLLFEGPRAFLAGLVVFLGVHVSYTGAFLIRGVSSPWAPAVGVAVFGSASAWLVHRLWAGMSAGLRGPGLIYGAGITAMTAAAFATLAGRWPPAAAAAAAGGALFFYFSDVTLSWNRFVAPLRHGLTVTLLLYWTGQLGIALAARWAGGW
jgi:alkenylglycerophosphocholine hydrolase